MNNLVEKVDCEIDKLFLSKNNEPMENLLREVSDRIEQLENALYCLVASIEIEEFELNEDDEEHLKYCKELLGVK